MNSYVSHLECAYSGKKYEPGKIHTISEMGKPIIVKYDLERIAAEVPRSSIGDPKEPGFWRYAPLLPVCSEKNRVSLGEVVTPIIALENLESTLGVDAKAVFVKDESRLPTGSFKARGLGMAVSMAKELGVKHLAIPTNGNAGSALAAYATRAGIGSTVLCPDNTPTINVRETQMQGGSTHLVNGLIGECGGIIAEGSAEMDLSLIHI